MRNFHFSARKCALGRQPIASAPVPEGEFREQSSAGDRSGRILT